MKLNLVLINRTTQINVHSYRYLSKTVCSYVSKNTLVIAVFLHASKDFDRVNHNVLPDKLSNWSVPLYFICFLKYWFANQTVKNGVAVCLRNFSGVMVCDKVKFQVLIYFYFTWKMHLID